MRKILYSICEGIAFCVLISLLFILGFCEILDDGIQRRKARKVGIKE